MRYIIIVFLQALLSDSFSIFIRCFASSRILKASNHNPAKHCQKIPSENSRLNMNETSTSLFLQGSVTEYALMFTQWRISLWRCCDVHSREIIYLFFLCLSVCLAAGRRVQFQQCRGSRWWRVQSDLSDPVQE